jgi:activator of 2-hydroxyglutaryl-CoA dehydratase
MRVIGLDIGSRTVKRVTVEGGEMVEHLVVPNNHDPLTVCDELLLGQRADQVVATGYGRHLFAEHREAETLTEIRAVALGAR